MVHGHAGYRSGLRTPGVSDVDCPPGLSDGTGPGLVINANLIQGNSADSGSGGGIRLQQVNGTEVATFPTQPEYWNDVTITNNIIVNNVAGWDGAGISLQDALNVNIINNTIAHNDTLASSGVLATSIGAPAGQRPRRELRTNRPSGRLRPRARNPPAVDEHAELRAADHQPSPADAHLPAGTSATAQAFSNPLLANNIFWQNRSFYIGVGSLGTGTLNQQNLISLFDAFTAHAGSDPDVDRPACATGVSYWDIGVRGDRATGRAKPRLRVHPQSDVLGADQHHRLQRDQQLSQPVRSSASIATVRACRRNAPWRMDAGAYGFGVPPGIADAVTPNPVFSLTPSATVDEGNNWINVQLGPAVADEPVG